MTVRASRACHGLVAATVCAFATAARAQQPTSPQSATEPASVASLPAVESVATVGGRVVAEALMGSGLATVGFLIGPELGAANCRRCLFSAGFAGANATFPIGVYWGGHWVGGEGSFWLTVAVPWAVSATAWTALILDKSYDGRPAFEIATIGGALAAPVSILLYELTNAGRRQGWLRKPSSACPQIALRTRRDGVALHVGGAF